MLNAEERRLVDELDREVSHRGSLLAIFACIAIAVALLTSAALATFGSSRGDEQYLPGGISDMQPGSVARSTAS